MPKLIRTVAVAAVSCVLLISVPSAASADTPRCVSKKEYKSIGGRARAMPRGKVTQIFDVRGRVYKTKTWQGRRDVWVHYRECGTHGLGGVAIHFKDYKNGKDGRLRLWDRWLTWID